jgi:hypothetical protein
MEVLGHGWERQDFETRFAPVISQMMEDRGWIMNCFAQIEFLAADIAVKARRFAEYAELLARPVDFGIGNRVKRLRQLCEFGPLAAHAEVILPLMDRVLELEETRHFFTHGFMSIHIQKDGKAMGMHLRRYVQPKKGELESRAELFVLPDQMSDARNRWTVFAQTALGIFRDVYAALQLEAHDVTDGKPAPLER